MPRIDTDAPWMLVTGASRGIGKEVALLAARRGYRVALNYHQNQTAAEAVQREINLAGGQALLLQADVSDETQVLELFERLDHLPGRLGALVNNAGILLPQAKLVEMNASRFLRIFGVNVIGTMLCSREAVRRMARSEGGQGGVIINLSSVAAKLGAPFEYVDYAASKGAVESFTLGLAQEVAREGIRVLGVRPGIIKTEIHAAGGEPNRPQRLAPKLPLGRAGEPKEVAQLILWLCSAQASYCTGSIHDVSGGR